MADVESLPSTLYLALEVLAARYRTGEQVWTFRTREKAALRSLEALGLVRWKSGIVENTCLAWLTEAGQRAALDSTYVPPGTAAKGSSGSIS